MNCISMPSSPLLSRPQRRRRRLQQTVCIILITLTSILYSFRSVTKQGRFNHEIIPGNIRYKKNHLYHNAVFHRQGPGLKNVEPIESMDYLRPPSAEEDIPTHRQKRTLPDFSNGGIVVFYHIYKTGGSTVGKMLHMIAQRDQRQHHDYDNSTIVFDLIRKKVDWKRHCLLALETAEKEQKVVLLELHTEYPAPDFPSLVEMAPLLKQWRNEAYRRNVGFFAFTLLREPMAHTISFFNFFHVGSRHPMQPPEEWNPFKRLVSTEENLMRSFVGNRQCQMLGSDPESTLAAPKEVVRVEAANRTTTESSYDCRIDKVYHALFDALDWVGTTEKLQKETLPLLTKLIVDEPNIGRNFTPFKVFKNNVNGVRGIQRNDLSQNALNRIDKETKLDQRLYYDVLRNFTLKDLGWKDHIVH